jgi:protein TonB
VLVTAEGLAGSVSVQTSSGSQALDQAALDAVKGWRFVPARQGTQAVEGWHLVPIVFKLEGVS